MPSYTYRCVKGPPSARGYAWPDKPACGFEDFELRPREAQYNIGVCENCGGETEYFIPTGAGGQSGMGCIRITDTKMWPNEHGVLEKISRTREIQQGTQSGVGRVIPAELHIDRIRQRIREGKVKV